VDGAPKAAPFKRRPPCLNGPSPRSPNTNPPRQDGSRIYIVLEYCAGGDLGLYIRRYGRVSEATARYFLVQLAEGLKELRRHNVIHVSRLYSHSHIRLCI
jgi:serine/threonine protein kinase